MHKHVSRRGLIVSGAGAAGLTLFGLPFTARAQSGAGTRPSVSVRVPREFTGIDPFHRGSPQDGDVAGAICQFLLVRKPNSTEFELDAAQEFKQSSPTTYDFKLKPGQMFSDGFGEMTAEDVKFSFERIAQDPKDGSKASSYKSDWINLVSVEVKGKYDGRIVLSEPRANVVDVAIGDYSGAIVSKKAALQRGADFITKPVGSGPYQLASYDRQKGIELTRNPAYKGQRRGGFDSINLRVITDSKTTELALRAGEVDFAVLAPAAADPLRGVAGLTVSDQPSLAYVWMGMNMEKGPLADLRVRQAIRLGLDVDQMLMAGYNGKVPRLNTLLPPLIAGHWREAPVYKRNVAEARALLAAAGVSNLKLRLTILTQPEYQNMALVAQALLAEIGVTIEVDAQAGGTYWSAGKGDTGKNLDLYMARFSGKHDPNFLMQWFTSNQIGNWNWSRWNSPEYDALFKASASETDAAKRRQLVVDAQKAMDKTSAYVWLTNEANAVVYRSWLKPAAVPGWINWQYTGFTLA